jgi:hypothetical protein
LSLNPAIWEAIAGTGFDRIDLADMGRGGLWWRITLW